MHAVTPQLLLVPIARGPKGARIIGVAAGNRIIGQASLSQLTAFLAFGDLQLDASVPLRLRYQAAEVLFRTAAVMGAVMGQPVVASTSKKGVRRMLHRHGFILEPGDIWALPPGVAWAVPVLRGNKKPPLGSATKPNGGTLQTGEPTTAHLPSMGPRPRKRKTAQAVKVPVRP